MAGRQKYDVSMQEFARVWGEAFRDGLTIDDVAEKLNMPKPIVMARCTIYRKKHGLDLRPLKRKNAAPQRNEVNDINRLLAELYEARAGMTRGASEETGGTRGNAARAGKRRGQNSKGLLVNSH